MRTRVILSLAVAVAMTAPARAETASVAVAGATRFGQGACLELIGGSSLTANRQRWLGAYWTSAPTALPGGVCSEEDAHEDLTPNCTIVTSAPEGVWLHAAAKGTDNKTYYLAALDASSGPDRVGVIRPAVPPPPALCGASEVIVQSVTDGSFTIVPIP